MPSSKIERKSAAIMFTDIAGYTEQMSKSEQKALDMLRRKRSILKPLIDNHQGTYVKEIGDGTLSYFESGYNASACAKEFQKEIQKDDLNIRIGIHIGDIVFDNEDVYGDGVNIASRIESLAPVGGVLISKNVYDELINKDDFESIHLGLQSLKGVGRLVDVYAIKDDYLVVPKPQDYKETEVQVHKDDKVPSIAIIPFTNKGAEEDVFYSYGISADLISACSSAGLIRVASLNNIEKIENYKTLQAEDLASKLDIRYTAEGTLWKMGEMFQLSIELYDTKENKVVWSDRWQEKWENLTQIQSSLSEGLLQALDIKANTTEKVLSNNSEAYEYYLKAIHKDATQKKREDLLLARDMYKKAYEIDKTFIQAKISYAGTFGFDEYKKGLSILEEILISNDVQSDKALKARTLMSIAGCYFFSPERNKVEKYNLKALELYSEIDDKNKVAQLTVNISGAMLMDNSYDEGMKMSLKAIDITKEVDDKMSFAGANMNLAYMHAVLGNYEISRTYLNIAEPILKKLDNYFFLAMIEKTKAVNYFNLRDFENAIQYFKISDSMFSNIHDTIVTPLDSIQSLILSNNNNEARKLLEVNYDFSDGTDDELLFRILYAIVMDVDNHDIEEKLEEYGKRSRLEKEPMFAWMIYYWVFVLFKDKKHINSSYNYLISFSEKIPSEFKSSFFETTIPKAIVEEWERVK